MKLIRVYSQSVRIGQALMGGNMRFVCYLRDKRAFTLIELIIVLAIILAIVVVFPLAFKTVYTSQQTGSTSPRELTLFFHHLAVEVREAAYMTTTSNAVQIINHDGDRVTIELLSSAQIRRTFKGTGHNLMLEKVRIFSCTTSGRLLTCYVEMENGLTSKKTFYQPY